MPTFAKPPTAPVSSRPHPGVPEDALEQELDEALEATFPASDPIAVNPDLLNDTLEPAGHPGRATAGRGAGGDAASRKK